MKAMAPVSRAQFRGSIPSLMRAHVLAILPLLLLAGCEVRKDEYAFVYAGAPECRVEISIHTDKAEATFVETVKQFAMQQGIRECKRRHYKVYSGAPRPTHKSEHVAIWSGVSWTTNASQKTGGIRLAPHDEKYPVEDFKRLADSLANAMRAAFPARVQVTFKEAQKP